ncbi:TIGR00725 family protein [Halospeciosus flavus]|uniref:TIGR00725 family protein n=1 Tax=Halospeciosus flavus TaxID=3032283 RepID=A0ABD5Z885_9EURY|nr:TIGR00725 family protein [Halospeciosus flavus]
MRVSVVGGGDATERDRERAERVGEHLAERGHTLVCGGRGGVMEAACRGAKRADGHTIGILPGEDAADANEYVDVTICTGIGHARNALVVLNGDAVVAVDGGGGTLSELGFAAVYERPVAGLGTFAVPHVESVESPDAAVEYVEAETS